MPVPEMVLRPAREQMTRMGLQELRTPADVDEVMQRRGTVMVAVNSMCGCASARMRPAVAKAIQHSKVPDTMTTVFAGQDLQATARAREYFTGYPPSSPSVAILRDGEIVYMMERRQIEGRAPAEIAEDLVEAFDRYC
jgi:putative YphP/YqiW family bacilliredoxin